MKIQDMYLLFGRPGRPQQERTESSIIDMDAFFAVIEQRDNPHLKAKPVTIGDLARCSDTVWKKHFGRNGPLSDKLLVAKVELLSFRSTNGRMKNLSVMSIHLPMIYGIPIFR